jgi:hypothetical protein
MFIFVNYVPDARIEDMPVRHPDTDEYIVDDITGKLVTQSSYVGDLVPDLLNPNEVICDTETTMIEDKPWLIIRKRRTLDYFKNHPEYSQLKDKN